MRFVIFIFLRAGLVMPSVELIQYTLRISFLDRRYGQTDENSNLWKEYVRKSLFGFEECAIVHFVLRFLLSQMFKCFLQFVVDGMNGSLFYIGHALFSSDELIFCHSIGLRD